MEYPVSESARADRAFDVGAIFIYSYPVIIFSHLLFSTFFILDTVYSSLSNLFSLFLFITLFFYLFSFFISITHHFPFLSRCPFPPLLHCPLIFSFRIFTPALFSASLILSATSQIHVHYPHRGPHLRWGPEYIFPPNGWNYFLLRPIK